MRTIREVGGNLKVKMEEKEESGTRWKRRRGKGKIKEEGEEKK